MVEKAETQEYRMAFGSMLCELFGTFTGCLLRLGVPTDEVSYTAAVYLPLMSDEPFRSLLLQIDKEERTELIRLASDRVAGRLAKMSMEDRLPDEEAPLLMQSILHIINTTVGEFIASKMGVAKPS